MDIAAADELLTTTRSVRKRLDLARQVPPDVIEECIEIAHQAPTGSNQQGWYWLVVNDPEKRKALSELYTRAFNHYASIPERPHFEPGDIRLQQLPRILSSAAYLNRHLAEVPTLVIACVEGRWENLSVFHQAGAYGSVLPSVWSFMMALRARGVGSAWTTLHLMHEQEAAELLGIPPDYTQAVLLPVAYYTGDSFKKAGRVPARERIFWDTWGATR